MQNTKIFEELAKTLGGKEKINEKNIASLLLKNRSKVRGILKNNPSSENLYKNQDSKTSWYLLFADFREHLGIPRYMELDTFNAFSEAMMVSLENINYDDFLKVFKNSQARSKITQEDGKLYDGQKVDKLIKNQGEYLAQGLVEIVANGIDNTVLDESIGRFGKGFYQSLKFLAGGDSKLLVQTKKSGEKGFELSLKEENGVNKVGSVGIKKDEIGTDVELQKKLSQKEQEELKNFLISRFKTNKKAKVILNGKLVNNLDDYIYYNGEGLQMPTDEVFVEVDENGFEVIDKGTGMSAKDLSEKLLSPSATSKKRLNAKSMSYEEITQFCKKETSFFYKHFKNTKKYKENNVEKSKQTLIRLQVGGVLIEEFSSLTSYDIEEFCLELPSFTWLPESRNKIELTKEVVVSLKIAMEKIASKLTDKKEQLMLYEIIAKIIKKLKSRESSSVSNDAQYDIGKVSKQTFKRIKQELEKDGKVVIAAIPEIQDIIPASDDIVFIDEELTKFEISKIPNIKKLANVKNKRRDFYSLEFNEKANYDYLILDNAILVNEKYIKDQGKIDLINAQVNLNTGYEQGPDFVFYGIIEDNKCEEKTKKNKNFNNNKIQAEKLKYSPQEKEIVISKFNQIIDDFEFHSGEQIDKLKNYCSQTIDSISQNRSARIEFHLSNSIHKITFFILNKLPLKVKIDYSEDFYKKFYDFALEKNEKLLLELIGFYQKILRFQNAQKYMDIVIDLLNDNSNASYLLQYLKEFQNISQDDLKKLFKKFDIENEENDNIEILDEFSSKKILTNIKNYLKENDLTFKKFYFVGTEGDFFVIETKEGKNLFFHNDTHINLFDGEFGALYGIHIGPDGDFRGLVYFNGRGLLFKDNGHTVIDKIDGENYSHLSNVHSGPNGDLRGVAHIYDKWLFKNNGNTIIYFIAGKPYKDLSDIHTGPGGDLRGQALVDGKWVLFKDDGNTIIDKIGGKPYNDLFNIHTGPGGDLRGSSYVDGQHVLFIDNGHTLIEPIGGNSSAFSDFHTLSNGDFRGVVIIMGIQYKTFMGDILIDEFFEEDEKLQLPTKKILTNIKNYLKENNLTFEILDLVGKEDNFFLIHTKEGKKILFHNDTNINLFDGNYDELCNIHIGPDGDLRGIAYFKNGKVALFKDNGETILDTIGGNPYTDLCDIHTGPDGDLRGQVEIYDKRVLFKDNGETIVDKIDGKPYTDLSDIHTGPDGDLRGQAEIGGKWVLFINDGETILDTIDGKPYTDLSDIHTGPDGDLRGQAEIDDKRVLFKNDGETVLDTIGGKPYTDLSDIHTGPDGDLRGRAKIDNKRLLFKDDGATIIGKIDGEIIKALSRIETLPNGDFIGSFETDGGWRNFIGDKKIDDFFEEDENLTSEEKTIKSIKQILESNNSEYASHEFIKGGDFVLITTTSGEKIIFEGDEQTNIYEEYIKDKISAINLKNSQSRYLQDREFKPEIETLLRGNNGELIFSIGIQPGLNSLHINNSIHDKISGYAYYNILEVITGRNSELIGIAQLVCLTKPLLFIGDELIHTIGGKEYDDINNISLSKAGEVKGEVLINGEWQKFIGDRIVSEDEYNEIDKIDEQKVPQRLQSFVEFLCKGGEFLKEKENIVNFESQNSLELTDLIGISRFYKDGIEDISGDNSLEVIDTLKQKVSQKLLDKTIYERQITSTIDGQDRASMIGLREVVQNSRDAILKSRKNGNQNENIGNVEVDFYQNNNSWISRFTDGVGMTSYEVFKYLLTPGVSGKTGEDGATGMFGQGFYSLMIGAKELNLKTSTGDGKTTYIKLTPKYNDNKDIIDFTFNYDVVDEQFSGTIIERYDESEGIGGNIGALIGINNLEKYVGNVDDVDISYNSTNIYYKGKVITHETQEVSGLGTLSLKQNKDRQERLTKDNLFLSEIKDEYLNFLPDFMIEYIRENGYSLDLPARIGLTQTRNAITDFEKNLEILKPHIFNVITRHMVKEYLARKTRLPMMPLDYYGLDLRDITFNSEIVNMALKVNSGGLLSSDEILQLKDRGLMIQYLINLQVENIGEIISIRELKSRRDDKEFLRKHTQDTYAINNKATSLNIGMEAGNRQKVNFKEGDEGDKAIVDFLKKVEKDYYNLVKKLFGCEVKVGVYERIDKDEERSVDYGFNRKGNIYFNFNTIFLNKFMSDEPYKLIELITHELTHLVEDYVKGYGVDFEDVIRTGKSLKELAVGKIYIQENSFGTHQKDLEHSNSFEKIQRDILKMMTREL